MIDDLYGADDHLEAAYEDANGSPTPEHLEDEEYEAGDFWEGDWD